MSHHTPSSQTSWQARSLTAGLLGLMGCVIGSPAQAETLFFTNTPDTHLPIDIAEGVNINNNGDLLVSCLLQGGVCPQFGSTSSAPPPSQVTLISSSNSVAISSSPNVFFTWNSVGATVCLSRDGSPGWAGQTLPVRGSIPWVLVDVGTFSFGMACYSPGGSQAAAPVTVTAVQAPINPPAITLSANPQTGVAPLNVDLSWTTSLATSCTGSLIGPEGSGQAWVGPRNLFGNLRVVLSQQGQHDFTLSCTSSQGVAISKTVSVVAGPAGTPPPSGFCPTDPQIAPLGWNRRDLAWNVAFSPPNAPGTFTYPSSPGQLVPLGAPRTGYTVIPFVPNANQTVQIPWVEVQPYPGTGYGVPRPVTAMFVGISPCPGDFRPTQPASADPFLRSGCRDLGPEGGVIYSTLTGLNPDSVCTLTAGQTYYINVLAANPEDGLSIGETTCISPTHNICDVGARSQIQ